MPEIAVSPGPATASADGPLDEPIKSRDDAEAFVAGICFKIGPPRLAGIELERLVYDSSDPTRRIPVSRLASALGRWSPAGLAALDASGASGQPPLLGQPLPAGAAITIEPGGQVELSTSPWGSIADCLAAASADADAVRAALARAGLSVGHSGIDPYRTAVRMVDKPRYAAMERYFAAAGEAGNLMMASTASVQISVDAGTEAGDHALADRWQLLHAIGPVLVALFANSPVYAGAPTGWHSTRQRVWQRLDPPRTTPAPVEPGADPRAHYAALALQAPLLCLPNDTDRWDAPAGVTFLDWLDGALERPATYADLEYHLSTLFPPVRAKGYLEVRYLDAQRGDDWRVPPAVIWTLLATPDLREAALAAVAPISPAWPGVWAGAARDGLTDPALAAAARALMEVALGGLAEGGLPGPIRRQVTEFAEHYTFRGRSPADDQLDVLAKNAELDRHPEEEDQ